jgi:anti-anti-sigma factor
MTSELLGTSAPAVLATFTVSTPDNGPSPVTIICARGEIDQANAHTLAEYAVSYLARRRRLIFDLTGLEFFGAAGFSALYRISVSCANAGMDWTLVPGAAVSRLLRICDPDGLLPSVDSVSAALASLQGSASEADNRGKTTSKSDAVSI